MTFDRGASLTTATTLGFSDAADLGPTTGNGFHTSWADDLEALSALGLTALRIPLDWARLQPKPGELDGDWAEWFDDVLTAVHAIGLQSWVTLHEAAIPRWFDNDGGMVDADTFTKWWPRWVERAADRFGDRVDGWIPFAVMPPAISVQEPWPMQPWPMQPWRDTWGILGGAGAPVVASVDASPASLDTFQYVERYLGLTDRVGVDLTGLLGDLGETATADGMSSDQLAERGAEAIGRAVRDVAERAGNTPLTITAVPTGSGSDAAALVEVEVATLDEALDDGLPIDIAFIEPAIGAPEGDTGLLDPDRAPTAVAGAYQLRT